MVSAHGVEDYKKKNKNNYRKLEQDNPISFILAFGIIILFTVLNSSYTIMLFAIINKRRLLSGDLFYTKHSGDELNLIYTMMKLLLVWLYL